MPATPEQEKSYVESDLPTAVDATPESATSSPPPNWVTEAARATLGELRLFGRTLVDFIRHPQRFAAEWGAGARRPLNPLAFFATSMAITLPLRWFLSRFLIRDPVTLPLADYEQFVAYLVVAWWGLLAHGVLRLAGSRQKLHLTMGLIVYTFGGVGAALGLLRAIGFALLRIPVRPHLMLIAGLELCICIGYFTRAVFGLHRLRWWWGALAFFVPLLLTGMVGGVVGLTFCMTHRSEPAELKAMRESLLPGLGRSRPGVNQCSGSNRRP